MGKITVRSFPVLTTVLTFLVCFAIILSGPYRTVGGVWIYKISVDSLGSALPTLSPASPSTVGLPDEYLVGLWSYCGISSSGSSSCAFRSPLFFFDLASVLFSDLASTRHTEDIQTNILLPSSLYPFVQRPASQNSVTLTLPNILSWLACAAYIIGFISSFSALATICRPAVSKSSNLTRSKISSLRRASGICALALLLGAIASVLHSSLILFALDQDIPLASNPATSNPIALFILFTAAALAITSSHAVLTHTRSTTSAPLPLVTLLGLASDPSEDARGWSSGAGTSYLSSSLSTGSRTPVGNNTPTRARSSVSLMYMGGNGDTRDEVGSWV
ncbi:uncharacterized protein V2V93DRAFT_367344 [Kockiozyma suomiensis]|uniref:uncharacterized protein n=1 Tax=Kockiozyma suomiensis TaxID=1337062 RepID=UPI0033431710